MESRSAFYYHHVPAILNHVSDKIFLTWIILITQITVTSSGPLSQVLQGVAQTSEYFRSSSHAVDWIMSPKIHMLKP